MGRKLERLMARVSALETAFTQLLSENLRHGPASRPKKKAKSAKAEKRPKGKRARPASPAQAELPPR